MVAVEILGQTGWVGILVIALIVLAIVWLIRHF